MNKLDILNREQFVDQLLNLTEALSANKASTCFALNGPWGCGKTFVLDMFQERLEQIQSDETYDYKYFVIRYNCWKFDYYEEPLVAIVASLITIIEEKTKLFPDNEKKREILGMLKAIGVTLLSIGNAALREKIGIDAQNAYKVLREGKEKGAADYEKEHDYDAYFNFNKVMNKLIGVLQSLSEEYTMVILVDELDRCLPEYAIKVLERLHHLSEDQSNIITIISIDKNQLMSTVKQLFGFENPAKYLEKFINFEVKLDYGVVAETISEKYADYFALFDKSLFPFNESVEECLQALFKNVDIRTQEQLIKRAMLAHKLLYSDTKDYSFMCMEVLLSVMICVYQDDSCFSNVPINIASSFDKAFVLAEKGSTPVFADFFEEKWEKMHLVPAPLPYNGVTGYVLPKQPSLYAAILFSWYWMHPEDSSIVIRVYKGSAYDAILKNHDALKKFAELIKMMSRG